jgi:hypothetical protein
MIPRLARVLAWAICLPIFLLAWPIVAAMAFWDDFRRTAVHREFIQRRGQRGILVYSNSPIWQAYIEQNWLPHVSDRMAVLNWSERSRWASDALDVELFRRLGGAREFNPLAIIFRELPPHATFREWASSIRRLDLWGALVPHTDPVAVIRFWQPFRDFKHGKDAALRRAEAEMFELLGIDSARSTSNESLQQSGDFR